VRDGAFGKFGRARVAEDVEGLQVRDAERVRKVDLDVEAKRLQDALFGLEERCAAALVRPFGDIVCFGLVLRQLFRLDEGGCEGGEVCVYVYEASR
jgi:hypothetical protein